MSKRVLVGALVGLLGFGAAAPDAAAQVGFRLDERGARLVLPGRGISEREAVRIARRNGVVEVDRVLLNNGRWRVIGEDRRGQEIRVFVEANTGRVQRIVRVEGNDEITERDAIRIARSRGVIDVDRVVRAGDEYRVIGEDRRGRNIRVFINAESGDVIRVVQRS